MPTILSYWMMHRPRHISLTDTQEKLLEQTNQLLLECARELFINDPSKAPSIAETYWKRMGAGGPERQIEIHSEWEEPWIPGALIVLSEDEIRTREDLIVLNPEALPACAYSIFGVLAIMVKPQIDVVVVDSKIGENTYVHYEPLQNAHIFISPEQDAEELPHTQYIEFSEDYAFQMIDPNTIQELVTKPS